MWCRPESLSRKELSAPLRLSSGALVQRLFSQHAFNLPNLTESMLKVNRQEELQGALPRPESSVWDMSVYK